MPKEDEIQQEATTIEDDMSAIFDEIQGRDDAEPEKSERVRGPDGKFAKADDVEPEEKEAKPKAEKEEKQEATAKPVDEAKTEVKEPEVAKEPEKTVETARPPSSWSAAGKAKFAALDPDVQKEVLKREDDFHRGIETYKTKAQFADSIYREIQPFEAMIRSQGSTPEASIRNLLGVAYQLSTGTPQHKQQVIAQIAQMYGVEMPQGEEMPQVDPTVTALQNQIHQLMREREQEKYQQETSTTQTLSNEIAAFQADPKNLYFDNVRAHMASLIQGGQAKGLQDAYDMACWANPDVRQQILAQQAKEADAKRIEEQKKAALDAKNAAPLSTRSKGGIGGTVPAGKTIADTMSATFDALQG